MNNRLEYNQELKGNIFMTLVLFYDVTKYFNQIKNNWRKNDTFIYIFYHHSTKIARLRNEKLRVESHFEKSLFFLKMYFKIIKIIIEFRVLKFISNR